MTMMVESIVIMNEMAKWRDGKENMTVALHHLSMVIYFFLRKQLLLFLLLTRPSTSFSGPISL